MKKTLLLSALACALLLSYQVQADTVSGKVTSVDGNAITVKTEDGQKVTMNTSDKTTYRKKKMTRKNKSKRGKKAIEWNYTPIAEEDDWVDVTYNPNTGKGTVYEIQDMVVYDD